MKPSSGSGAPPDGVTAHDTVRRDNNATVASLVRALRLLEFIALSDTRPGVPDLSEALGFSRTTVQRLLRTMESRGFVARDPETHKYSLGIRAIQVGLSGVSRLAVLDAARPHMEALARSSGETVNLAVEDTGEIVYVHKVEGPRAVRTHTALGSRRPMNCTALGKVLLASIPIERIDGILAARGLPRLTPHSVTDRLTLLNELSQVRRMGYAVDHQETEEDVCCIAAPIRGYEGKVLAGLSIAGPSARMAQAEPQLIELATGAAHEVSQAMGFLPRNPMPFPP